MAWLLRGQPLLWAQVLPAVLSWFCRVLRAALEPMPAAVSSGWLRRPTFLGAVWPIAHLRSVAGD
jgi:hypothetical protein